AGPADGGAAPYDAAIARYGPPPEPHSEIAEIGVETPTDPPSDLPASVERGMEVEDLIAAEIEPPHVEGPAGEQGTSSTQEPESDETEIVAPIANSAQTANEMAVEDSAPAELDPRSVEGPAEEPAPSTYEPESDETDTIEVPANSAPTAMETQAGMPLL